METVQRWHFLGFSQPSTSVSSPCVMRTAHVQKLKNYKIAAHAHGGVDGVCDFIVLSFAQSQYTYREDVEVDGDLKL